MTYVEKLARLVYYLLIAVLGAVAWALLGPIVVLAVSRLAESGAWDEILVYGGVAVAILLYGGLSRMTSRVVQSLPHAARGSRWFVSRRSRWFVICGLTVIAGLLTFAGYDDSRWSGVAEAWGLAGMVVLFWGIVAGIVVAVRLAIKTGHRVVARLLPGNNGSDGSDTSGS